MCQERLFGHSKPMIVSVEKAGGWLYSLKHKEWLGMEGEKGSALMGITYMY